MSHRSAAAGDLAPVPALPREDPAAPAIRVRNLEMSYEGPGGRVAVLKDISLDIGAGERLVLLGPSGCGKTTLLRCIAGLEQPDSGEIEIGGELVFSSARGIMRPADRRHASMVFQSYALWPHMTVYDNVAFPLVNLRKSAQQIADAARAALAMVGCADLEARYPAQLSGGQQQRIALARAIVGGERLVLFDEPLSNIDAQVRERLRVELVELQRRLGFSALYVTHDQVEAFALADRIAVMSKGEIQQIGVPEALYREPANAYVAGFVGSTNELNGTVVEKTSRGIVLDTPLGRLVGKAADFPGGSAVRVFIRPERLSFVREHSATEPNGFDGSVVLRSFLGLYTDYIVAIGGTRLLVRQMSSTEIAEGDDVRLAISPDDIVVFIA